MMLPVASNDGEGLHIVAVDWDVHRSVVRFERSDGKEAVFEIEQSPELAAGELRRSTWRPDDCSLVIETYRGDPIAVELPQAHDLSPVRDRAVIYLDQKDWSNVAWAIHDPARCTSRSEFDAARQLIRLWSEDKVVLPMSSAHMSETCKWQDDSARYSLALTILQLSGGWQIRDPLEVRLNEIRDALKTRFNTRADYASDVVTLDPNAIHSARRSPEPVPDDFPPDIAHTHVVLTAASANLATMLDRESTPMDEVPGWSERAQGFSDWLRSAEREPEQRRASTDVFFFHDLQLELASAASTAGITVSQLGEWVSSEMWTGIAAMPALGLFREVLHHKLVDNSRRFSSNDLVDMMYLTVGAGYCDFVVTDREATDKLRKAQTRQGRSATVVRSLSGLIELLVTEGLVDTAA